MMKYSSCTCDLVGALESASPASSGRHQPHLLIPSAQTINQKKETNPELDSTPNKSYQTALVYLHRNQG